MYEVKINGSTYFADVKARVLYTDREKKSGTPFTYLTANELTQLEKAIRFPEVKPEYA